jgi:hypothetical protein
MRSALLAVFVAALAALTPGSALAETYPLYHGDMSFQAIQGPEGPDEYSWEVQLYEGQELRQVDERTASVIYESGHQAFAIEAVAAHDAEGKTVPTTLTASQPNIFTLTVYHRDGSFVYPVTAGEGWVGGFQSVEIVGPPDESELARPLVGEIQESSLIACVVPDLTGRTLRASRKILHQSHCRLGAVHGEQVRAAHVVKQYRRDGRSLPLWTTVDVKALTGLQYVRAN